MPDVLEKVEIGRCPRCKSKNIEIYNSDWDGEYFWYECECHDCKTQFDQLFEMKYLGVNNIQE